MQLSAEAQRPQQSSRPPIRPNIGIHDAGLIWGLDSVLVRMRKTGEGQGLDLYNDQDRLLAMLWAAGYRPPDLSAVVRHLDAASSYWRCGEKALANFRLVFARLPRIAVPADAYRLALAEHLLDQGLLPQDLQTKRGFEAALAALEKYSPDQPRVPAGNGVESGQWEFWPEAREGGRSRSHPIRVAEADEPEDKLRSKESRLLNESTPQEQLEDSRAIQLPGGGGPATSLPPEIGIGRYAGPPILAGASRRPSPEQRSEVTLCGREYGCHTCGTIDPGTTTGQFVCDHQPPNALVGRGEAQYFYPQCLSCSRRQGGYVKSYKYKTLGTGD